MSTKRCMCHLQDGADYCDCETSNLRAVVHTEDVGQGVMLGDLKEPSLSDVLVWLGWEKCENCDGAAWDWKAVADSGLRPDDPVDEYPCPGCVGGLVPSTSIVEAACEGKWANWESVLTTTKVSERASMKAALVASMRTKFPPSDDAESLGVRDRKDT